MSCAEATTAMTDGFSSDSSKIEVLLGIAIDHEFKFDENINYVCKKASLKLNALAHIAPFMNVCKKRIIMKSFNKVTLWILFSNTDVPYKGLNNKINRIHERALSITYNVKSS